MYSNASYGQAYKEVLLGTPAYNVTGNTNLTGGLINTSGISIASINTKAAPSATYGPGTFGFFSTTAHTSLDFTSAANCCEFYIGGASLYTKDKLSPFLGGIQEPIKSHTIKPKLIKYIKAFSPCAPQNSVLHIGNTNVTSSTPVTSGSVEGISITSTSGAAVAAVGVATTIVGSGSGTGLTVNFVPTVGSLTIVAAGSGYVVGDAITLNVGTAPNDCNINATVSAVSGTGAITQVILGDVSCNGTGSIAAAGYVGVAVVGGTGSAATITVNTVQDIVINAPGVGYAVGTTMTATSGTSTVKFTITAVSSPSGKPSCCKPFYCGESYSLRVDVVGTKAFRNFHHRIHQTVIASTGCCTGATPTAVDPTNVMIQWAEAIVKNPYLGPFIFPVVYDYTGVAWFPPASILNTPPYGYPAIVPPFVYPATQTWDKYAASAQAAAWNPASSASCAGLRLEGAYVDTQFGNCSFHPFDIQEPSPVKIIASLVDYTGDPCNQNLCIVSECDGHQGQGYGDTVIRRIISFEGGRTANLDFDDIRERELLGLNDIIQNVNRSAMYWKYIIGYEVESSNNTRAPYARSTYEVEIWTLTQNATLETWLNNILSCTGCGQLEVIPCHQCVIEPVGTSTNI